MVLHEAFIAFTVELQSYDDRADGRNIPDSFWTSLGALEKARKVHGKPPKSMRPPESVAMFVSQNLDHGYIARAWGLYDEYGDEDLARVQKEIETPGSVINDKYVHPNDAKAEAERDEQHERYAESLETIGEPAGKRKPCKETPKELFRQGVEVPQAANMLMKSIETIEKQWAEFSKTIKPDKVPVTGPDGKPKPEYVPTGGPMTRVDNIIEDTRAAEETDTEDTGGIKSPYDDMNDDELAELAAVEGIEATDRAGMLDALDALDSQPVEEVA
jgi:hypothetical protein